MEREVGGGAAKKKKANSVNTFALSKKWKKTQAKIAGEKGHSGERD